MGSNMKILYSVSQDKTYPYSRADDSPIEGLDSDLIVLEKIETARPEYDPLAQEAIESWTVVDNQYIQSWEIKDLLLVESSPDWDGLYKAFIASQTYQYLVGVGLGDSKISSELSKVGTALVYGITVPNSPAALPAFQSALNLFLFALNEGGYPFPVELNAEVESILAANNFPITLP